MILFNDHRLATCARALIYTHGMRGRESVELVVSERRIVGFDGVAQDVPRLLDQLHVCPLTYTSVRFWTLAVRAGFLEARFGFITAVCGLERLAQRVQSEDIV